MARSQNLAAAAVLAGVAVINHVFVSNPVVATRIVEAPVALPTAALSAVAVTAPTVAYAGDGVWMRLATVALTSQAPVEAPKDSGELLHNSR